MTSYHFCIRRKLREIFFDHCLVTCRFWSKHVAVSFYVNKQQINSYVDGNCIFSYISHTKRYTHVKKKIGFRKFSAHSVVRFPNVCCLALDLCTAIYTNTFSDTATRAKMIKFGFVGTGKIVSVQNLGNFVQFQHKNVFV